MTVLHSDEPLSMKGVYSEHHNCIDCGYNTNPGAPPRALAEFLLERDGSIPIRYTKESEVYTVRNKVWKAAGMEPLEKRLGRKLKPKDFAPGHPFKVLPGTPRLIERRGG